MTYQNFQCAGSRILIIRWSFKEPAPSKQSQTRKVNMSQNSPTWIGQPLTGLRMVRDTNVCPASLRHKNQGKSQTTTTTKNWDREFPGSPVVGTRCFYRLPTLQFQTLLGELRSHMLLSLAKQDKTKPQSILKKKSHFGTIQRKTVEKRGLKERGVVFPQAMTLFIKITAVRGKSRWCKVEMSGCW